MEKRSFQLELKALDARQFQGHGAVFGNVDLGGDIVMPGAFARSLAEHKAAGTMPLMFWMHQPDQVPGVWLDMSEDKEGLAVHGELVDTTLGRDVRTLLQKKAVRGLSIGYVPQQVGWDRHGNRLLIELDLIEVSIVSMGMNPLATIESAKARLSAAGEYVPTAREIEQVFRTMGCSKSVARHLTAKLLDPAAGGKPALPRWDAGEIDDEDANEPEAKAALAALQRLTDVIGVQALRAPRL